MRWEGWASGLQARFGGRPVTVCLEQSRGAINVFASNDTDLVIDVTGYLAPAAAGALSLFTISACRALDASQQEARRAMCRRATVAASQPGPRHTCSVR